MNSELAQIYLTTASVSILGYHHDLGEPVIRLWNDAAAAGHALSAATPGIAL